MKTEIALALIMISATSLQATQEVPPSGSKLGSVTGGVFKEAHLVIDNKCVSCHTSQRIEQALAAGKNMQEIQHRMEQKGVKLTADEQTVLGIFWKDSPLRKKK
jgi:uncharacterized membrane protein